MRLLNRRSRRITPKQAKIAFQFRYRYYDIGDEHRKTDYTYFFIFLKLLVVCTFCARYHGRRFRFFNYFNFPNSRTALACGYGDRHAICLETEKLPSCSVARTIATSAKRVLLLFCAAGLKCCNCGYSLDKCLTYKHLQ